MAEIKIYTRPGCPYCIKLKKILDREGIKYEEHNVSDKGISERIITRDKHTPVPQVEISGRIIFDYTTEEELVKEIKNLLNK
ncbi:MAG: glutaredoxin [Nanoarchaeota archaeon]